MHKKFTTYVDRFFKDKHGKWAVAQWPNTLLWLWIALFAVSFAIPDAHLKTDLKLLQSSVLFAWSYLEVTEGASYFRKVLGAVVLVTVVVGYFI